MADVMEWQREIYFAGEVSLKTPRTVPPSFPQPLPKPKDPLLAGMGERFGEILLLIVTCTILYLNRILRNQDRSFENRICLQGFLLGCKTASYINVF